MWVGGGSQFCLQPLLPRLDDRPLLRTPALAPPLLRPRLLPLRLQVLLERPSCPHFLLLHLLSVELQHVGLIDLLWLLLCCLLL